MSSLENIEPAKSGKGVLAWIGEKLENAREGAEKERVRIKSQKEHLDALDHTGNLHFAQIGKTGGEISGFFNGEMVVLRVSESGEYSGTHSNEPYDDPKKAEMLYLMLLEAAQAPIVERETAEAA